MNVLNNVNKTLATHNHQKSNMQVQLLIQPVIYMVGSEMFVFKLYAYFHVWIVPIVIGLLMKR